MTEVTGAANVLCTGIGAGARVGVHRSLVVGLDDPVACDPAVSGAKGAGLARARAAGLPVLNGYVVAAATSVPALGRGRELLASSGTGGARLSIIRTELDDALVADIARAARGLAEPVIVRSSSVLEGGGEWSGAFTSVPEVRHDEIPKAIRSVWATSFALDVMDRFEAAQLEPGSVPMAVLVQPEIVPDFAGAARVDAAGVVTVDAVKGSPRDLMAGWEAGARAVVERAAGDSVAGQDAVDLVGSPLLRAVADLASRVQAELGHNLIEWAVLDGELLLLQVQDSLVTEVQDPVVIPAALAHPLARDFVHLAQRYPGALGEELVLGWLAGLAEPVEPKPVDDLVGHAADQVDHDALLDRARLLAASLLSAAWGEPEPEAVAHARLVLRRLRSDRPDESIDALRGLRPVDPDAAARLLGMYECLTATVPSPHRRGTDRWEPVLAGVAALQGEVFTGTAAGAGGIGAGRLVWVDSATRTDHVRPRDIVVSQYPLQNYSPLLWDAAGVVTLGGASTAHLFEVARSLTVPAVVNCPIGDVVRAGPVLGMLDGDAGRVAILR